jgi:hypothetical protein
MWASFCIIILFNFKNVSDDEALENVLNYSLCEVVYEWAKGTDFADVCAYYDGEVQEG